MAIVLWIASFIAAVIFLAIQVWLMGGTVSIFSSAFRQLASWASPSSPASAATQAGGFAG